MKTGKFNIIYDGQWGSTGKGNIAGFLANKYNVTHASTTNLPNAGHTAIVGDYKFVSKIIPASCVLNRTRGDMFAYIGAGAGFQVQRLFQEMEECKLERYQVLIHPRAMVVTEDHMANERETTAHIASTMQGSGIVQAEKMMRGPEVLLARDHPELQDMIICPEDDRDALFSNNIHCLLRNGATFLHEGSQGFSLGINHGSHYPFCTSRECTPMQAMADMGIPPHLVGDIYMVIRPYPIRVGNLVVDGETLGESGGYYNDHEETSWEEIAEMAGAPPSVGEGEITTVTKRLRRVFTTSFRQIELAAKIGGATKIALNFANYLDWKCYGTNDPNSLSQVITDFIQKVEEVTGVPVTVVGTGPNSIDHVMGTGPDSIRCAILPTHL